MDVVWPALPDFLIGARNTIIYCVVAFPLALLFGLLLALMSGSRLIWLMRASTYLYRNCARNTYRSADFHYLLWPGSRSDRFS